MFQFVSGLFFLALANVFWVRSILLNPTKINGSTFLFLALCAFCGGNGLITASIVGTGFALAIAFSGKNLRLCFAGKCCFTLWFIAVFALWISYHPSQATFVIPAKASDFPQFAFSFLQSWLGVFATWHSNLALLATCLVLFVALVGSLFFSLSSVFRSLSNACQWALWLPVCLASLQTVLMAVLIALARCGAQPWWPGLELHSGYLATPIALSGFLVLLLLPNGWIRTFSLLSFAILTAYSFILTAAWRVNFTRKEFPKIAAAVADLASSVPADVVAEKHIKLFYWREDVASIKAVSNAIVLLRQVGFWGKALPENK